MDSASKKALKMFFDFIIYILIFGGIIFGLPRFLTWSLNTAYPMAAITSGSMWPALKEGDLVFVQGIGREQIAVGDIIVFSNASNNTLTIHRVKSLGESSLVTKGDANFTDDTPVKYENVIGRSLKLWGKNVRIPYLGFITTYASKFRKS